MAPLGSVERFVLLIDELRSELERCDRALLSYELGMLDDAELRTALGGAGPPVGLDAVHSARALILDLLGELGTTAPPDRSRRPVEPAVPGPPWVTEPDVPLG